MTNRQKLFACFVLDMPELVEYLFKATRNSEEGKDTFGKFLEGRGLSCNRHPTMKCPQRPQQFPKRLLFEVGPFNVDAVDVWSQVEEILVW